MKFNQSKDWFERAAKLEDEVQDVSVGIDAPCEDPNCPCQKLWPKPDKDLSLCPLNKPIWMVISPPGIHLPCPIHGQHWVPANTL